MSADEDLEIHQHGEPWEKACERMAVLGFAEPTGEESHADGDVLLGRTVFVNKLGEGRVIEFIPSMFGRPGQHKVRFSPKRGGAQNVRLRRKGNTEELWLIKSEAALAKSRRSWLGKEATYTKMMVAKKEEKPVGDALTAAEKAEHVRLEEEAQMREQSFADRRAELVAHWKTYKPHGTSTPAAKTKLRAAASKAKAASALTLAPAAPPPAAPPQPERYAGAGLQEDLLLEPPNAFADGAPHSGPGRTPRFDSGVAAEPALPVSRALETEAPLTLEAEPDVEEAGEARWDTELASAESEPLPAAPLAPMPGPRLEDGGGAQDGQPAATETLAGAVRAVRSGDGEAAMPSPADAGPGPPPQPQLQPQPQVASVPESPATTRLRQQAAELQSEAELQLQRLALSERQSLEAAAVGEQLARLRQLQDLWSRTAVPARTALPQIAADRERQCQALEALTATLSQEIAQASGAGQHHGPKAGFLLVAHDIMAQQRQPPPAQPPASPSPGWASRGRSRV